jgi:hypothetical protein
MMIGWLKAILPLLVVLSGPALADNLIGKFEPTRLTLSHNSRPLMPGET